MADLSLRFWRPAPPYMSLIRRGGRASGVGSCTAHPCRERRATDLPGAQRANRGLAMTSAIVTYLHRRKSRQAKAQAAASWRRLASSTWGATAATDERKSEDDAHKVAEGYREPNRDEADNLAPARGIAVSVLVGIAMWLAIVALVLLITWFFWVPT
jgi:hypothetical protein